MTHKNRILPVAIIGAILLITIGGFIVLTHNNDGNNEQKKGDVNITNFIQYIENTTKQGETHYSSTFGELNKTADLQFKVGEKYFYHRLQNFPEHENENIFLSPEEYDTVIEVRETDRINQSNYYVLASKNVSVHPQYFKKDENGIWKKKEQTGVITTVTITKNENGTTNEKISKENTPIYEGCTRNVNKENSEVLDIKVGNCPVLYEVYAKWMLYLDKGVKWIEKQNDSDQKIDIRFEKEWTVNSIEKINGIECFKVGVISKTEILGSGGKKISSEIVTYWIDVKKRILVKMEKREDGVLTETIELKNYEKP